MKRTSLTLAALTFAATGCAGGPLNNLGSDYAALVIASYDDSITTAETLDAAVASFVTTPDAAGMTAAKNAWLAAREPYLQTEVYRFYDGPIDDPTDGPEGLLNAWPLDEKYIDYVNGEVSGAFSGIVNDPTQSLDVTTLVGLNEAGGEKNIATGYHAVEFLLWGQDESSTGPGTRPFGDYTTTENADRRGLYLELVSGLIVDHLNEVRSEWTEGGTYRNEWDGLDGTAALERILTGMIILSGFETGGERLQAALSSGDQEDEHSCFSDNTHRDMVGDVQGVLNAWDGLYTRPDGSELSGVGVRDVVEVEDATLAAEVDARLRESVVLAEALQSPFDQEIAPGNAEGNARVQALVDSLRTQEAVLFDVFTLFGLTVDIPTE